MKRTQVKLISSDIKIDVSFIIMFHLSHLIRKTYLISFMFKNLVYDTTFYCAYLTYLGICSKNGCMLCHIPVEFVLPIKIFF